MAGNPTTKGFHVVVPSNLPAVVAGGSVTDALNFVGSIGIVPWQNVVLQALSSANWSAQGVTAYSVGNVGWVPYGNNAALAWDMQVTSDPIDAAGLAVALLAITGILATAILAYYSVITLTGNWWGAIVLAAFIITAGAFIFGSPGVTDLVNAVRSIIWIFGAVAAVGAGIFLYDFLKGGPAYRRGVYRGVGGAAERAAGAVGHAAREAVRDASRFTLQQIRARERKRKHSGRRAP